MQKLSITSPQDTLAGLKRVRHKVSTAISFVESAFGNLSGDNRDVFKSTRLYEVGSTKLREALDELDALMDGNSSHE